MRPVNLFLIYLNAQSLNKIAFTAIFDVNNKKINKMRVTKIATALMLCLGCVNHSMASASFTVRVPLKEKLSNYDVASTVYSTWVNNGVHYDCDNWSPHEEDIVFGTLFTQERSCSQEQTRIAKEQVFDSFSNKLKIIKEFEQKRVVTEEENRPSVGILGNWVEHDSVYTEWANYDSSHSFGSWTPDAENQVSSFVQNRSYTQPQERFEQKYEIETNSGSTRKLGELVRHTQEDIQSETRVIDVVWSDWTNTGEHYNCGDWGPLTNTVGYNQSFTQARDCNQDRARNRTYMFGSTTLNSVSEAQTIDESEFQSALGVGSWTSTASLFTEWTNNGQAYGYNSWAPVAGNQTDNYSQSRTYNQDQSRTEQKREFDIIGGSVRNVGSPISQSQTVTQTELRTIYVNASTWSNSGSAIYGSWSPSAYSQTASFTQTRSVNQPQSRTWTHSDGATVIHSSVENQTIAFAPESRLITVSWSAWLNYGSPYACGSWSPLASSVNYGQSFTQTRSCAQDEVRYRNYSDGSSFAENNTYSVNDSRSATGTYQNWAPAASTCGSWYNSGSYSYGSWSPGVSGQLSSFTQYASYSVQQSRSCNNMERDSVTGQTRVVGTYSEYRTDSGNTSRTMNVSVEPWRVIVYPQDNPFYCNSWEPDSSTVTSGQSFTQVRYCWYTWYRGIAYTSDGFYQPVDEYKDTQEPQTRTAVGTK